MTTYLRPTLNRAFLCVADVIDRLRVRFAVVVPDNKQGLTAVAIRARERNPAFTHVELDALLKPLADSSVVVATDDPNSDTDFLRSLVVPNEPIRMDWVYPGQRHNCAALLQRYADAIGYAVTETNDEN